MKKLPTLIQLRTKAWTLLSEKVRKSAANIYGVAMCYTCGSKHMWKDLQGGHFFHGVNKMTYLMQENIRPQCVSCNRHNHGNLAVYSIHLLRDGGGAVLFRLYNLYQREFKPTRAYYENKIKDFMET